MQRTSFWLTLPLIALAGFALSFYSPRGAHAGSDVRVPPGRANSVDALRLPRRGLMQVSDRAAAPQERSRKSNQREPDAANSKR